jgi:hypothetical protein
MYVVGAHAAYLTISIALTIWVARTLVRHGRIFLVDTFLGNELLADSVNRLLAVRFYLLNVGYVAHAHKYGDKPVDLSQAIETPSTKVGSLTPFCDRLRGKPLRSSPENGPGFLGGCRWPVRWKSLKPESGECTCLRTSADAARAFRKRRFDQRWWRTFCTTWWHALMTVDSTSSASGVGHTLP